MMRNLDLGLHCSLVSVSISVEHLIKLIILLVFLLVVVDNLVLGMSTRIRSFKGIGVGAGCLTSAYILPKVAFKDPV